MEKRSISGRDILRMDGLLPPTRRLPVCDAVISTSDKKKEKKWSIGGILKLISSIRDYDSSSNEEEMVYCKREPKGRTVFNKRVDSLNTCSTHKSLVQEPNKSSLTATNENVPQSPDSLNFQKDSIHSRSSDGSLDGMGRKSRKNKLKARAEAKRDRICADSSSDEDSRKSCSSLTRLQYEDCSQSSQKTSSCNRKSRAARTERYIKRLSKDEGHGPSENLSDISNKRNSLDSMNENHQLADANGLFRPPIHPRRVATQSNSHTFPVKRSTENLQECIVGLPATQTKSSIDLTKYPADRYLTDLNQNNTYAKPNILKKDIRYAHQSGNNYFLNTPRTDSNYVNYCDYSRNHQVTNRSACPPEPPPRDPRRVSAYGCHSFPFNRKCQRINKFDDTSQKKNDINDFSSHQLKNLRSCDSNDESNRYGSIERHRRRPLSLNESLTQSCNLAECTNNRHNSTGRHVDEPIFNETEAMKCQRRNIRNNQLNSDFTDSNISSRRNIFSKTYKPNIHENCQSPVPNEPFERLYVRSPSTRTTHEYSRKISNDTCNEDERVEKSRKEDELKINEDDPVERKRSSKNLEEALSELEAIYNSLRLGDEDLLDRAERRSMEEFSLRRGKTEETVPLTSPDVSDRTKDDMAYRRMNPKERPTSLSDVVGQSTLSSISYLMASPILSRKDRTNDYPYARNYIARRDEPDVTRDDVVYRSIHHANNTLKVVEPQPPFGIPLGPVTTATDSDYLHTIPTKPDHPRSPYIPQCEPDIVTDDLAYRALRKDANTTKNAVESKTNVTRDLGSAFGTKKKRAVRSLSANLYGLINHDRIHLQREPSFQEIGDEIQKTSANDVKPFFERPGYFRRVVSDGELSDYDTRWSTEGTSKSNTDINGNHPLSNVNRKKLRVYISPSTQIQSPSKKSSTDAESQCSTPSDVVLPSKTLEDGFWHNYLRLESNGSPITNKDGESDFTAYSRLCQDLVNLIEGPDDVAAKPIKEAAVVSDIKESVKIDDHENQAKSDESSFLHIQSLGSQYTELDSTTNSKDLIDNGDIERLTESLMNSDKHKSKETEDNALDFYLRLADENVKLIAEAFSSVADHLRDSRTSRKNSSTPRCSEIENDSTAPNTSTRSSVTYSQDDLNDEPSTSLRIVEKSDIVPVEDKATILEKDQKEIEPDKVDEADPNVDVELDLTRAVHDLQIAAASLFEHEKEIEELETRLGRDTVDSGVTVTNVTIADNTSELDGEENCSVESGGQGQEEEQDRDQQDTTVPASVKAKAVEHDLDFEGESTECELICTSYESDIARSSGMRVPYVTNLITVMITTYSMVLLACFLALLLATVAAS